MKKKIVPLSISPDVVEDVDLIAKEDQRSRSSLVELVLKEFIQKRKQSKTQPELF